ncbi:MAG: hypothetical protein K1Y02_19345 [Candidatus Hydrogenedentes bacterium]|nr:hypothetical protein [Candidatus Hydrogenedentota bacterium]
MNNRLTAAVLWAVLLVCLTLGAIQGNRVQQLRDAESFYRWIMSASTQFRLFGEPGHVPDGEDPKKYRDEELFQKLVEQTDSLIPEIPESDTDYDQNQNLLPKVVRYLTAPKDPEAEKSELEVGEIVSEEQVRRDTEMWGYAKGPELAELRTEFLQAMREGRVSSVAVLNPTDLYQSKEGELSKGQVSLANIFFGFRKMAANLVWLEVDRYFHMGQIHRMVPLMKTCVLLDPGFVDAYLLGAWHLSYNATANLEDTPWTLRKFYPQYYAWMGEKESFYYNGIEFLKSGIRNNPRNYKLYFDLGYSIYENKLNDHPNAIKYLKEAIRLDHDRWVRRQLYRILGENDQLEESLQGWRAYLEWQPTNEIAPRFIKLMEGRINDRSVTWKSEQAKAAEELLRRAEAAGDTAKADVWRANAAAAQAEEQQLFTQSREFWQKLVNEDAGQLNKDTFAVARLARIKAEQLRRQGLYLEAIVEVDRARWESNEFWDQGTHLMLEYKREGNIPLQVTELRQLDREAQAAEYTIHLPKSIDGKMFYFSDADRTWYQEGYQGDSTTPVQANSDAWYELLWEHPEATTPTKTLDGPIVYRMGDVWYRYEASEPAKAAKTDGLLLPLAFAKAATGAAKNPS